MKFDPCKTFPRVFATIIVMFVGFFAALPWILIGFTRYLDWVRGFSSCG